MTVASLYHAERPPKLTTLVMVDLQLRNFREVHSLDKVPEGSTLILEDVRILV